VSPAASAARSISERLEPLGRHGHVDDRGAARHEHARELPQGALDVDMQEDVAAPDPLDRWAIKRQLLGRSLDYLDVGAGFRDGLSRQVTVDRERIESRHA